MRQDFAGRRRAAKTPRRRAGCWRWRWFLTGSRAPGRRRAAAWTGRGRAIGGIATTPRGLAGLSNKRAPGAVAKRTAVHSAAVAEWVRVGPSLVEDGVVRWRRIDLAHQIERAFGVSLAERSVGNLLRRLGFRRVSARPQHPKQDAQALAAHKKRYRTGACRRPAEARGKPLDIGWQDEARVARQGTLSSLWADRGSRPRDPRDQRHRSA